MRHLFTLLILLCATLAGVCPTAASPPPAVKSLSTDVLMEKGGASSDADYAYACFAEVVRRYRAGKVSDPVTAARALNNCGHILFHDYEKYSQCYSYFSEALDLARKHKISKLLPIVYLNLGNLYLTYANRNHNPDDSEVAVDFYKKGFSAAADIRHYELLTLNFTNILSVEMERDEPRSTATEYERFSRLNIPDTVRGVRYARSLHHVLEAMRRHDYAAARARLKRMLPEVDARYSADRYRYAILYLMAKCFRKEGNTDSAINYNLKIEELARTSRMPDVRPDNFKALWEMYARKGDSALAAQYRLRFLEAKDSMLNVNDLGAVGQEHYKGSLDDARDEIESLSQTRRTDRRTLMAVGGAALLALVVLMVLLVHYRRVKRRNRELYEKNLELLSAGREVAVEQSVPEPKPQTPEPEAAEAARKYSGSGLDEATKDELYAKILDVFTRPEEFCSPQFDVDTLARLLGEKTKYVSQVINERFGCTFSILLGNNRAMEACRRMNDAPTYRRLTIEAISAEMGFKSRTTFLSAFRRVTGLTPSQYQRMAIRSHYAG